MHLPVVERLRWYDHDPVKRSESGRRYPAELAGAPERLTPQREAGRNGATTLALAVGVPGLFKARAIKEPLEQEGAGTRGLARASREMKHA